MLSAGWPRVCTQLIIFFFALKGSGHKNGGKEQKEREKTKREGKTKKEGINKKGKKKKEGK